MNASYSPDTLWLSAVLPFAEATIRCMNSQATALESTATVLSAADVVEGSFGLQDG